jgi:ABC-type bacteriocin/lantibiotic exporter with double-glycine peptidase domain
MDSCRGRGSFLGTRAARHLARGCGRREATFDIVWFIPALVKYCRSLRDVLIGFFFLKLTGLVSPIFL